jgi:F0F1-type ATP synthase assembly protein I
MAMVSTITTISFMMVIPPLLGFYLDNWLGTVVLFMFLGVVFGLICGIWQLTKLVNGSENHASESSISNSSNNREIER